MKVLTLSLYVVYIGFVGPWLFSAASTTAVLIGVAIGLALIALAYHSLAPKKEKTE